MNAWQRRLLTSFFTFDRHIQVFEFIDFQIIMNQFSVQCGIKGLSSFCAEMESDLTNAHVLFSIREHTWDKEHEPIFMMVYFMYAVGSTVMMRQSIFLLSRITIAVRCMWYSRCWTQVIETLLWWVRHIEIYVRSEILVKPTLGEKYHQLERNVLLLFNVPSGRGRGAGY